MEIYFINFDLSGYKKLDIKKFHTKNSRVFLKKILASFYDINSEILSDGKKPYLLYNPVYFSISHSNSLFCYAISTEPVGVDVEYIKERDFEKIINYMRFKVKNYSKEEFYRCWTTYEANYKSGLNEKNLIFEYKNYKGSISSKEFKEVAFFELQESKDGFIKNKIEPEYELV